MSPNISQRLARVTWIMLAGVSCLPGRSADDSDEYRRTANALAQYRILAAEDDGTLLPAAKTPVKPGDLYAGVPRLMRLLERIGDLAPRTATSDSGVYQGPLVAAIK